MNLVFFLEGRCEKEMLEKMLPNILPNYSFVPRYIVFEGKQDLEAQLVRKLRGWRLPQSVFIVLRDQDQGNCIKIKGALTDKCKQAGRDDALVRIVCRELESWYFGDLEAVEKGLRIPGLTRYADKSKYRIPDDIVQPAKELKKITREKYQKIAGSRAIAPHLSRDNASNSYRVFIAGLEELVNTAHRTS